MTDAKTLGQALDALLQPEKFRDYGPNGLQVQGRFGEQDLGFWGVGDQVWGQPQDLADHVARALGRLIRSLQKPT